MSQPTDREPAPLFRGRDLLRLMTLFVGMVFILWAIGKASKPQTWEWARMLGPKPAADTDLDLAAIDSSVPDLGIATAAGQAAGFVGQGTVPLASPPAFDLGNLGVMAQEFVPLPPSLQRVPAPDQHTLKGSRDRSAFLVEDPENPESDAFRRDADARYHLIQLARDVTVEDFALAARKGVRYTALREKPQDYRGDVLHVEGTLLWVLPLELKRPLPGLDHVYQGLITTGTGDQAYWVLFTELPPGFPPQSQWARLYLHQVQFDGYFLKTLLAEDAKEKGKRQLFPVLVGRSPRLPAQPTGFDLGFSIQTLVLTLAGVAFLACGVVLWLRRSDRRYHAKMAEVRSRARKPEETLNFGEPPADVSQPDVSKNGHH